MIKSFIKRLTLQRPFGILKMVAVIKGPWTRKPE